MSSEPQGNDAWVELALPMPPEQAWLLLSDPGRLFRLHPHLRLDSWEASEGEIRARWWNEHHALLHDRRITVIRDGTTLTLGYDSGFKQETRLELRPDGRGGAVLALRERYADPHGAEYEQQLPEVDFTLTAWGVALRRQVVHRRRWGWIPGYAWFLDRFWLHLTPAERRFARLLGWISLLEFILFLGMVGALRWL